MREDATALLTINNQLLRPDMGNGAFCTSNKANVVHPQEEVVASAATQQLEGTSRPPLRVVSVTATALATASAAKMTTLETTNKYRYMLIEGK